MPPLWSSIATLVMAALSAPLASGLSATPAPGRFDLGRTGPTQIIVTRDDADQRPTVDVRIGGQGPFRFLVDTGAQNTVLADDLATRLGLIATERHTVTGVAGTLVVDTVSLEDVRIGQRAFSERFAPLLRADVIRADGILGIDALQGQRVLFDFAHQLLSVSNEREPEPRTGYDIVVTARRRMGQLIISQARIDGIAADMVIDTGTDISIGNRPLQRALAHRSASTATRLFSVTGQAIDAQIATAGTLRVDHLKLANMQIAFADSPAFAALHLDRHPAFLLGMRELRAMKRVEIDFARRKVLFDVTD